MSGKRKGFAPLDGAVVEYWLIMDNGFVPRPVHYRATFYVRCAWKDHPWSRDRGVNGADFENQWTIESFSEAYTYRGTDDKVYESPAHWSSEGRSDQDWLERRLADGGLFTNEQAAKDRVRQMIVNRIAEHTRSLVELRSALKKA